MYFRNNNIRAHGLEVEFTDIAGSTSACGGGSAPPTAGEERSHVDGSKQAGVRRACHTSR
ncbi:hypothetical protein SUDANB6_05855 [Streptomyces sp. enrichment culture]|uniref:hypothetical protein n=1 Tax=Streptomyces sp. enrichment culture TaxID=1795815 RepID=UPI003F55BDC9